MDFHWTALHTWLSTGVGFITVSFFYKRIGDIASGTAQAAGEYIFKHFPNAIGDTITKLFPFLKHKKIKAKGSEAQMIKIAQLKQKVDDLTITVKSVVKKLDQTSKRLEDCQGERAECRADLKNILFRVEVLEEKRKHA